MFGLPATAALLSVLTPCGVTASPAVGADQYVIDAQIRIVHQSIVDTHHIFSMPFKDGAARETKIGSYVANLEIASSEQTGVVIVSLELKESEVSIERYGVGTSAAIGRKEQLGWIFPPIGLEGHMNFTVRRVGGASGKSPRKPDPAAPLAVAKGAAVSGAPEHRR